MKHTRLLVLSLLLLGGSLSLVWPEQPESKMLYYCPMHPQAKAGQPGPCPLCKMPLKQAPLAPASAQVSQPSTHAHADHEPRHGGLMGMTEKHHPEYVYKPNGEHRVYLSDEFRNPIPAKDLQGTFAITYPDGRQEKLGLRSGPGGAYLVASERRKVALGAQVRIALQSRGEDFFMDFVPPAAMINAPPEPMGWPALLTYAFLILVSLGSLFWVFVPVLRGRTAGDGRHFSRGRLISAALVVIINATLFYVANAMLLPRIEEAHEASEHAADHKHPHDADAGLVDGGVRISAQTQTLMGIRVEPAAETILRQSLTAQGKVTPRTASVAEVYAPVAGRATAAAGIPTLGEFVKSGQVLATVEPVLSVPEKTSLAAEESRVEPAIIQAQNTMNQAQLDYQRAERLYEIKAMALREVQHHKLAYENAKSAYEGALKQREIYKVLQPGSGVARYPVRAPIAGVVTQTDLANGEQITPAKRLFTIMDLSTVWVQAQVYESDLAQVLKSRHATVRLDALPDEEFAGRLKTLSPIANETTRTVDAIFEVANPGMKLRVGLAAKVFIEAGAAHKSIAVPAAAVLEEEGRSVIYVARTPEEFVRRQVQVGLNAGGLVEIKSGLQAGEPLVVQGAPQIRSAMLRAARSGGKGGDGHAGHGH